MSLSKPLNELVLPDKQAEWEQGRSVWFVTDPNCPDQKREPGENKITSLLLTLFDVFNVILRSFERRIQTRKWFGSLFESKMLHYGRQIKWPNQKSPKRDTFTDFD